MANRWTKGYVDTVVDENKTLKHRLDQLTARTEKTKKFLLKKLEENLKFFIQNKMNCPMGPEPSGKRTRMVV